MSNLRLLGYFLLVYFGGAVLVIAIVVTGGKQSQLLVQKQKLGLWTGV